jgi:hypothetical protein
MPLKRSLARTMASAFDDELRVTPNHRKIIGKIKKSAFCVPYSVMSLLLVYTSANALGYFDSNN